MTGEEWAFAAIVPAGIILAVTIIAVLELRMRRMSSDERAAFRERARQANLTYPQHAVGVMKILFPVALLAVVGIFVLGLFAR